MKTQLIITTEEDQIELKPIGKSIPEIKDLTNGAQRKDQVLWSTYLTILFLAIDVKVLQPLAIANAKTETGDYKFNESVMVLSVELMKFLFCSTAFILQYRAADPLAQTALTDLSLRESFHFLVPSILYAASNTLVYYGMSNINPALFHVFGNMRILVAGILYRLIMKKKQTDIQWLGLVLIACGTLLSAASPAKSEANNSENYILGLVLIVLMSVFSTSASIYTEKNYKKTKELSIFFQNSVLYAYGILINFIILIFSTSSSESKGLLDGFNTSGLIVLLVQSLMGISLSFIFKYLDNIVYVISLTVSMFLTSLFSSILFEFKISLSFVCSLVIVTIAIYIYYRNKIFEKYKLQENDTLF
jgi:solute carrier family 35 (UDP-sugar transporter), member A1/2/3